MYKFLLCWRYLRTRWIALASIISVTLGVATMIVVNAVMAGFTQEMQDRIRGILSDVSFEARSFNGFRDPEYHMREIEKIVGDEIEVMTPTVTVPAMLSFQLHGEWNTRPVQLIGIPRDAMQYASKFRQYLQHPKHREQFRFELQETGYDLRDRHGGEDAPLRVRMETAGMVHRRNMIEYRRQWEQQLAGKPLPHAEQTVNDDSQPANDVVDPFAAVERPLDPFAARNDAAQADPAAPLTGCVLGIGLVSYRHNGAEHFLVLPGDDIQLTFPTAGTPPKAVSDTFTVVDLYESKMTEYDSSFIFVPLDKLQELRGMFDRESGTTFVTSIQIKLKDESRGSIVRDKLQAAFPPHFYSVSTWRDKQGPLLAAVEMETAILNMLLFLIIAVAGFGILAIFFMIVVEKTKDIGILKSLGAHGSGIMGIFLSYGLSLGLVGAGAGMVLGLLFVRHINEIRIWLGNLTGQMVFDPSIYYFYEIPTSVNPWTVAWIVIGALAIAVAASVMPALRAARLHPVEALRYE
mgnify:CR=1 FL=1